MILLIVLQHNYRQHTCSTPVDSTPENYCFRSFYSFHGNNPYTSLQSITEKVLQSLSCELVQTFIRHSIFYIWICKFHLQPNLWLPAFWICQERGQKRKSLNSFLRGFGQLFDQTVFYILKASLTTQHHPLFLSTDSFINGIYHYFTLLLADMTWQILRVRDSKPLLALAYLPLNQFIRQSILLCSEWVINTVWDSSQSWSCWSWVCNLLH